MRRAETWTGFRLPRLHCCYRRVTENGVPCPDKVHLRWLKLAWRGGGGEGNHTPKNLLRFWKQSVCNWKSIPQQNCLQDLAKLPLMLKANWHIQLLKMSCLLRSTASVPSELSTSSVTPLLQKNWKTSKQVESTQNYSQTKKGSFPWIFLLRRKTNEVQ